MDNFKHKKSLGQNFLKDEKILNDIVNAVDLTKKDLVIEIGPGHGALTRKLKEKEVNLICFEIDERTKPYLEKLQNEKTKIIFQDFLTVDLNKIIKNIKYEKLYIIANIPYYITTPIIKKIIDENINLESMVLMVQNEVANRFSALPNTKDYGSITVFLNYYYNVEKLFVVPSHCFEPAPKIDSAIIKFDNDKKNNVLNEEFFFKLVNDAFKQKRKNLRNNLREYDLDKIDNCLAQFGKSLQNRAEELDIDIFIDLANKLNI